MKTVMGSGPIPCRVMAVGEAPGREEAYRGRPFVGDSGKDLARYVEPYGIVPHRDWYLTNVSKTYNIDNPDPTPEEIAYWSDYLRDEVRRVNPEVIIAIGKFAASWFLGRKVSMDRVHGVPFVGAYEGRTVIPAYHPAAGMHRPRYYPFIQWDYAQVGGYLLTGQSDRPLLEDPYTGREDYRDVTGRELAQLIAEGAILPKFALDTEGTKTAPWSVQVSSVPGTGYTLRCSQPDSRVGIDAMQRLANRPDALLVVHNGLYDVPMCRVMGLELAHVPIFDSMYALYLLGFEAQGLKPAAFRFCGMPMSAYSELVDGYGKEQQLGYLLRASEVEWVRPPAQEVRDNNGRSKKYRTEGMTARLRRILAKIESNGPEAVDIPDAWYKLSGEQYAKDATAKAIREVEEALGPLPSPTLDDVPREKAIWYASRDPDATLRLEAPLSEELRRYDLTDLMARGMRAFPVAEEVQATGMPADRQYFVNLQNQMLAEAYEYQDFIIDKYVGYYDKEVTVRVPYTVTTARGLEKTKYRKEVQTVTVTDGFNPGSSKQVAAMLDQLGLEGIKRTKTTGAVSTNNKSIGHLAASSDFVASLFEYRRRRKIATDFCKPVIERIPATATGPQFVHSNWSITRTASRRYATSGKGTSRESGFNLMNIPIRTKLGQLVRAGYICPEGFMMLSTDYSKIEPRCLAHLSGDPLLRAIFLEDRNIYKETGARIWGIGVEDITSEQYDVSKTVVLGQMYGMGPQKLLEELWSMGLMHWTLEQCSQLIDSFWQVFAGAAAYKQRVAEEARAIGYVRDHWGHYRYLPNLNSHQLKRRAEAERHAVSHKVQSFAQGMIQNGTAHLWRQLVKLRQRGRDVRMCLQMHDEIVLIYRDDEGFGPELEELVADSLVNHSEVELSVPVVAAGVHGRTWGELKG